MTQMSHDSRLLFLRRELWGRQDSPSMLAHFEEKDFKNIKVGKWEHKGGEDGRSDAALTRDISYLLPGSFGIAARSGTIIHSLVHIDTTI